MAHDLVCQWNPFVRRLLGPDQPVLQPLMRPFGFKALDIRSDEVVQMVVFRVWFDLKLLQGW